MGVCCHKGWARVKTVSRKAQLADTSGHRLRRADILSALRSSCPYAHFKDLGDYDYRPAREVADADENTEVRSVIDLDKRFNPSDGQAKRRQHSLSLLLPKM